MAAVNENRGKRGKRTRQTSGQRSPVKVCASCGNETRWLSVDNMCWDCTIQAAKNKTPIYIEPHEEEDSESGDRDNQYSEW
ncbi:MAG: hypothetical protein C4524_07525 [Candidatus Zixiibacteriota bacterium]|nr:MAG: hypothetical protein C4524_07525 [candidate division Zixibacteria bacterium]